MDRDQLIALLVLGVIIYKLSEKSNFNDDLVHYRMKLSKFATDRFDGSDEFFLLFLVISITLM